MHDSEEPIVLLHITDIDLSPIAISISMEFLQEGLAADRMTDEPSPSLFSQLVRSAYPSTFDPMSRGQLALNS